MESIRVTVVEFGDRKHYQMQYRDPITGRKKTRSTGVKRTGRKREHTEAERVAAKWESELREGRYVAPCRITWADFRERYENEVLTSLAETTDRKVSGVFNVIEKHLNPTILADLTAARLSGYQAKLREDGAAENTIKGHMAHLGAALNWAKRMGLLAKVPTIDRPRRAKGSKVMKGRPISGEEFDRLLAKVEAIVGVERTAGWRHYLEGLWASGLRLTESLQLYWDRDDRLCVDLSGKRPMLRIPGALEKGNPDRMLPIAPEFAEFLLRTPQVCLPGSAAVRRRATSPACRSGGREPLRHEHRRRNHRGQVRLSPADLPAAGLVRRQRLDAAAFDALEHPFQRGLRAGAAVSPLCGLSAHRAGDSDRRDPRDAAAPAGHPSGAERRCEIEANSRSARRGAG